MNRIALTAGICTMALLASGCGDDSDQQPSDGGAPAANAPQGEPFLLGWINQDKPGAVPTFAGTPQALAAVEYVNGELGGVGGRPLELVTCSTNGSPESSQACANQLISAGVKVVTKNFDVGWEAAIEPFQAAGVTVLGGQATAPGEYAATNAFYYVGGVPVVIAAMANLALREGENVAVLTSSNSVAESALPLLLGPLEAAGVEPEVVTAPDDAADFAPYAAALQEANPDAVAAILTPTQCLPVMKALASVNFTEPVVTTGGCKDDEILEAAGDAADGWTFGIPYPDYIAAPDDPINVLYREAWKEYGSGPLSLDALAIFALINTVGVAEQLNQLEPEVLSTGSAAEVQEALRTAMTAPDATDPITGNPLRCGESETVPAVCGFSIYFFGQEEGSIVDSYDGEPVDGFVP